MKARWRLDLLAYATEKRDRPAFSGTYSAGSAATERAVARTIRPFYELGGGGDWNARVRPGALWSGNADVAESLAMDGTVVR